MDVGGGIMTGTPDINSSEPCNTSPVLHELHTTRRSEFSDGSSPYDANRSLLGEIKHTGTGFTITTGSTHLLTIHFNAGRHTEILLLAGLHIRIKYFHDLLRRGRQFP
jgi:hypothetical protein